MAKVHGWDNFLTLCRQAKTPSQLNELLELFLTVEERNAIGLRVQLISELMKGDKTQREIAADLKISIAKITRGSNALKIVSASLKKFLAKVL
ncbi:MAG: trp operon repressor [Coxiellaceae bacterium]|nr:trp operon repressor [Coxiellaceae bacterium]